MDTKKISEDHVVHYEDNGNFDRSWRDEKWGQKSLTTEAQDVTVDEKELGPIGSYQSLSQGYLVASCVLDLRHHGGL